VDALYSPFNSTNTLVVFAGVNNFTAGDSAATVYAKSKLYMAARKAVGWKVILVLEPSSVPYETQRNALNTLWGGDFVTTLVLGRVYGGLPYADRAIATNGNPLIGMDGDSADTTYFSDGTHLTRDGATVLAGDIAIGIESLDISPLAVSYTGQSYRSATDISGNSIWASVISTSGTYTSQATEGTILVSASSSNAKVILPFPSYMINQGRSQMLTVKRIDSSGNALTISPSSGLIEGGTSYILGPLGSIELITDGTNFWGSGGTGSYIATSGTYTTLSGTASVSINPNGILALASSDFPVVVTGAALGDQVILGPPSNVPSGLIPVGIVTATGTATIRISALVNITGSAQTWTLKTIRQ
jgi:hypothetical protein